jgi:hypothetical protein
MLSTKSSRIQKPNIAYVLSPGIITFSSPNYVKFYPIIYVPASPNPRAKRCPIFTIDYSIFYVSFYSYIWCFFSDLLCISTKHITPASLISFEEAARGFLAISLTFSIILSKGSRTSSLASLLNKKEDILSIKRISNVLIILNMESNWTYVLIEQAAANIVPSFAVI